MKKLKKTDSEPSFRSTKLSRYVQGRVAKRKEAFILRDDVFAFIGIFTSANKSQMSFYQNQTQ